MDIVRRKVPIHYIPIHDDNVGKKNWVILLEAGTIVGRSSEMLQVAKVTKEKTIVTKYDIVLRKHHYLVMEEYDPQFHILYFCPQLYKSDSEGSTLVRRHNPIDFCPSDGAAKAEIAFESTKRPVGSIRSKKARLRIRRLGCTISKPRRSCTYRTRCPWNSHPLRCVSLATEERQ
jgi:hypothetical protein